MTIPNLPTLEFKGNHRQLGQAIGEEFKDQIQKTLDQVRPQVTPTKISQLKTCLKVTQNALPNLVDEISGIAQSAKASLFDIFLLNCREILDEKSINHCTTIVSFASKGPIVGHNEDADPADISSLYVLKAQVNGVSFTSFSYAYELPGTAASLNQYGLCQCIDNLHPTVSTGIPKNFLARALIESRNLDHALNTLQGLTCASGFNHFLVQGNELLNIEVACNKLFTTRLARQPFVHANHYLATPGRKLEAYHTPNSEKRYASTSKLIANDLSEEEVTGILKRADPQNFPGADGHTIARIIVFPTQGTLRVND